MSDKQVIFYSTHSEPLGVAAKLCEKLYDSREKVLFLFDDIEVLKRADAILWTYSKLSFLPHGSRYSLSVDSAEYCYIWLSDIIEFVNHPTCLLLNGLSTLRDEFRSFEKIIDIFDRNVISFSEDRWQFYQTLGFEKRKIWNQTLTGWEQLEAFS